MPSETLLKLADDCGRESCPYKTCRLARAVKAGLKMQETLAEHTRRIHGQEPSEGRRRALQELDEAGHWLHAMELAMKRAAFRKEATDAN